RLTPAQEAAMDLIAEVGEALCYRMRLDPGDMQLLNNHVIYHARDAFTDDATSGQVRRLFRLWLAMPNSRAPPEDHAVLWGDVRAVAVARGRRARRDRGGGGLVDPTRTPFPQNVIVCTAGRRCLSAVRCATSHRCAIGLHWWTMGVAPPSSCRSTRRNRHEEL